MGKQLVGAFIFIQSEHTDDGKSHSKRELWTALNKGSRQALSILFRRFYDRLFRYGRIFSENEEIVKDGIQKLFLRLWEKRKILEVPKSISGYLFVSLRRILIRNIEQSQSRDRTADEFMKRCTLSNASVEEKMIAREVKEKQRNQFHQALQVLTPRQKEALLLRLNSGLSNLEIAKVMDISDKRVRNLIYEAITKLREEVYANSE